MTTPPPPNPALPKMRSWLFAPGDSEKKMAKAIASDADIALIDLEDSVVPDRKAEARKMVADAIAAAVAAPAMAEDVRLMARTGTLTLTGEATLSAYEAALRSVTYENLSEDPAGLSRTVTITVDDGNFNFNLDASRGGADNPTLTVTPVE